MDFINSGSEVSKLQLYGEDIYYVPTRTVRIPVDSAAVIANGTVKPEDADKIVPYIDIKLKGSWLMKSQLIVLDMLANNNWKRPVYFVTGYHDDALGLEEYFQLDGLAFRLVPIKSENKSWFEYGRTDNAILYENMMKKFVWGGINDPDTYIDYYQRRTLTVVRARLNYARLASSLAEAGEKEKATEVLEKCMSLFPVSKLGFDIYFSDVISAWFKSGNSARAAELSRELAGYYFERTGYFLDQRPAIAAYADQDIAQGLQIVSQVLQVCYDNGEVALAEELNQQLTALHTRFLGGRQ
jgi:hypothetical protein